MPISDCRLGFMIHTLGRLGRRIHRRGIKATKVTRLHPQSNRVACTRTVTRPDPALLLDTIDTEDVGARIRDTDIQRGDVGDELACWSIQRADFENTINIANDIGNLIYIHPKALV